MGLLRITPSAQYGAYSKVDKEDPEELVHRRAQFLIYKALQQADSITKPSSIRIRFRRLSLRLGRRLKKLRKSTVLVRSSAARSFSVYNRVISQLLKTWKLLFVTNGAAAAVPSAALLITSTSSSKS